MPSNSELDQIHNLKIFKAATNQAVREGVDMPTLTRFQKNWEDELLSWRNREVEEAIVAYIQRTEVNRLNHRV